LAQLRYNITKFCSLTADAGQRELHLSLGELHGWSLGPKQRKPYGHSGNLRRLGAVHCLHSPSGSPMWNHAHALNVRVDLERSSRCFGQNEELDVSTGR
jgi:hypothetical protein